MQRVACRAAVALGAGAWATLVQWYTVGLTQFDPLMQGPTKFTAVHSYPDSHHPFEWNKVINDIIGNSLVLWEVGVHLKPTLSSVSTRNHVSSYNFLIATILLGTVFLKKCIEYNWHCIHWELYSLCQKACRGFAFTPEQFPLSQIICSKFCSYMVEAVSFTWWLQVREMHVCSAGWGSKQYEPV